MMGQEIFNLIFNVYSFLIEYCSWCYKLFWFLISTMSWSNLNQELLTLSSTFQSIVVNGMDFSDRPYREILYMSKLSCGSNKISDYLNQAFNIINMLYVHWFWWLKMILYIFSTHWHYLSIYLYWMKRLS